MTAIEFENISKQYQLGKIGTGTLSKDLNRWWAALRGKEDPYLKIGQVNNRASKAEGNFVWALRDINFKVEQGEVLGIIGKNGSGKSTLLKILSKVTSPTTGRIRGHGRVASLLEVGTGFHPEMTGRENIYMNGAIMGMTKAEIDRKFDEIVDFAGVSMYIDTPVKRYSSGMMVRLGFAVAAHLEPEILVVDEVLAVGDAEFQKKAIGKMQDVSHSEGRTVLFVSHNMAAVRNLCTIGLILNNGEIQHQGNVEDCISAYIETNVEQLIRECDITEDNRIQGFAKDIEFMHVKMINDPARIASDEPLEFEIELKRNVPSRHYCQLAITILDSTDQRIIGYHSLPYEIPSKDIFKVSMHIYHHDLYKGRYKLQFIVGERDYSIGVRNYDATTAVLCFDVKYVKAQGNIEFMTFEKWWRGVNHSDELVKIETL